MMRNLSLVHLKLGIHNLFNERHADLLRSKSGKFHEPDLLAQRDAIDELPPDLTGGRPMADELRETDISHDGFGAAIFFVTEAAFRLPDVSLDVASAAQRIREAFIPGLDELQSEYAKEAHRAQERRPLLKAMKADLSMLMAPDGRNLLEIATQFLNAGQSLDDLLHQRANVPQNTRADAATIRNETIGALNRFRQDLRREIKRNPNLPKDLEHRVFGYFDTLATSKGKASLKPPRPEEPEVEEPETPDDKPNS